RVVQDPRARAPGASLSHDCADARGAASEVRLSAGRARDGSSPAWRDRLRDRPDVDGARTGVEPARHDRVSQEPGWSRPDEWSTVRRPRGAARRARHPASSPQAMSGFALRFAVEVAFLVLLALAVGLAELATPWIVAVMVAGWLLGGVFGGLLWAKG